MNTVKKADPNAVLDEVTKQLGLKNDAALARALEVAPPVISKIRHYRLPIGSTLKLRILRKLVPEVVAAEKVLWQA